MRRAAFPVALALAVLATPLAVDGQPTPKLPRIGILTTASSVPHLLDALREGLAQVGYVGGRTAFIEHRSAEGRFERLPDLAAELVGLKIDVLVAGGTPATQAAQQATSTVPIVMVGVADPVGSGFVASLSRPGRNVTGLTSIAPELAGKRLQLLKEAVPGVAQVAVLSNPGSPYTAVIVQETEFAARALGVQLHAVAVRRPEDLENAFREAARAHAGALITVEDPFTLTHRRRIVALAAESRLPAVYGFREFVDAGGLMSYAANLADMYRRAATFVDKILKGARPADLPVEQPTKFINLKTARALGLVMPPSLLLRADQVIE